MEFILLFYYFIVFIFGLCAGSFLNCVVCRLEKKQSFLRGRSFCPECKEQLRWQDLIPVFSFLFLKGKCRYCKKKISWQYSIVEIATGLLFLLIFNFQFPIFNEFSIFNFQTLINFCFLLIVFCFLAVIFVYDLKHYLIPDKILLPAIIIFFLYRLLEAKIESSASFFNYILAALLASGFFFLIFLVSGGRWIGFGDVKLAVLMGFILGLSNILTALFLAFFFGAIISVALMALAKKGLKSEIPFGPFLITGTFLSLLWGEEIIQWYFNLLNFQ